MHAIAHWLVVIGGLNWGLMGVGYFINTNLNVLKMILGSIPTVEYLVYVLVGVSTVHLISTHRKNCKSCGV